MRPPRDFDLKLERPPVRFRRQCPGRIPDRRRLQIPEKKSPAARWCCRSIYRRRTHRESPADFVPRRAARRAENREPSSVPDARGTANQTVCPPSKECASCPVASRVPKCRQSTPAAPRPLPLAARKAPAAPLDVLRAFHSPESLNVADYFGI